MFDFNTNPRAKPKLEVVICPACQGLGNYSVPSENTEGAPCQFCEGRGRVLRSTKVVYYQLDDEMTLIVDKPILSMRETAGKPRLRK